MKFPTMWLGKFIELTLSGCKLPIQGEIIDMGQDLIVVYGDQRFTYVPLHHLQSMHITKGAMPVPPPACQHLIPRWITTIYRIAKY